MSRRLDSVLEEIGDNLGDLVSVGPDRFLCVSPKCDGRAKVLMKRYELFLVLLEKKILMMEKDMRES